jgi:SAM-dependent methyltransferase
VEPSVAANFERWTSEDESWRGYLDRGGKLLLEERVERCLELVLPRSGGRLLDIGAADGRLTRLFAERARVATAVGIDLGGRPSEVPTIKVNLDGRDALPFPDRTFDIVVCMETLEHVHDTDHLLAEARRVLAPDGYLILSVPRLDSLLGLGLMLIGFQPPAIDCSIDRRYGAPEAGTQVSGHVSHFTRRALLEILRQSGFEPDATAQASIYSGWMLSMQAQGQPAPWNRRLPLWALSKLPWKRDVQIARARPRH